MKPEPCGLSLESALEPLSGILDERDFAWSFVNDEARMNKLILAGAKLAGPSSVYFLRQFERLNASSSRVELRSSVDDKEVKDEVA
ncbi:MAG: hypothetical protein CMH57_02565 [Myxococcales bacterium]|nr:hypothetical protein [Myxococcales bacterium]